MPTFDKINLGQKKLILDDFFGEEAWITIKKMTNTFKKKADLLSWESIGNETSQKMFKELKAKGITAENIDTLPKEEAAEIMLGMKIDFEEKKKCMEYTIDLQKMVFEKCIDPDNHNFFSDGNKVKINDYDFWDKIGNSELIDFIFNEIKGLSKGFFFGKNGGKK